MGLRKYKRQIAKNRMAMDGVGNVGDKMHLVGPDGVPNWRRALLQDAEKARLARIIANKNAKRKTHRIKKVEGSAEA